MSTKSRQANQTPDKERQAYATLKWKTLYFNNPVALLQVPQFIAQMQTER